MKTLWTEYSGAAGAKGHNIRLTVCRSCGNFCDKYVEHDFVVMFIDLVLIKPQVGLFISHSPERVGTGTRADGADRRFKVYRHLLHNTLMREHDRFDVSLAPPFGCVAS